MSAKPVRMYSGPESVMAADAYRLAVQARRDQWPYPHVFPPPNATDVLVLGTVATETPGTGPVEVLRYPVNSGKFFFLTAVVLGSNATITPGDALFTVARNSPVGIPDAQFSPEHGLVNVPFQLGTFLVYPWHLQRAREFAPLDVVSIQATNVGLSVGSPTFYQCGIFGYEVPVLDLKLLR